MTNKEFPDMKTYILATQATKSSMDQVSASSILKYLLAKCSEYSSTYKPFNF